MSNIELSLRSAITKVELVHNVELNNLSDFIQNNRDSLASKLSTLTNEDTLDTKYNVISEAFKGYRDLEANMPFLLELSVLIS
jgi:hypothetical protein